MPVNFLTEDQRSRWGRFNEAPDLTQLGGFFHLEAADRRRAMAAVTSSATPSSSGRPGF
jgi:hypothetical protein